MGFKRTSEGRVFFQGAEEGGTAKKAEFRSVQQPGAAAPQATQFQILTLLKALNEKLKDSQSERARMRAELDSYRKHIEDIESKVGKGDKGASGKAERAEKLAEDTFKELKETRKMLLEIEDKAEKADKGMLTLQRQMVQAKALGEGLAQQQEKYQELVKRIDDSETKHEDLNQKIEKTSAEQSRILRQIEKVAEDRTRFMRKIERIEETVIQTRDALSAKAMVLLTEQGASKAAAASPSIVQQVTAGKTERPRGADAAGGRWQESFIFQAGVAVMVLAMGVVGGWAVSKIREIPFPGSQYQAANVAESAATAPEGEESYSKATEDSESPDAAEQNSDQASAPPPPQPNFNENSEDSIASDSTENSSAYASDDTTENVTETPPESDNAPQAATAVPALAANDDIGTVDVRDQQKLASMLDDNPDQVAAELNKIEPGTAVSTKVASLAEEPKKPLAAAEKTETPAAKKQDLETLMKRDTALPPEARDIERQAYAGMPEAQHDLAAIYTAGQGGVAQDYKRAAFWFRQAADQGISNASYNLGVLNHQGLGMKPDIKEAIRWYKKAAAQGHPEAQYNLGIAYIEGIGVGYDPAKAAQNFESAAQKGIIEAAYNLGLIYENGLLGEAKPDQALRWYKQAADKGSPEAKEALEQLAKTLNVKVEDVNRIAEGVTDTKSARPAAKVAKDTKAKEPVASPTASKEPIPLSDGVASLSAHETQQALLAKIQEQLVRAGLYPGPADGTGGALTEDAIRAYQSRNNLHIDGEASEDLLKYMLANTKSSDNAGNE